MKLWQTRKHWDIFAQTDPYWAVLSEPAKRGGKWEPEDFFATGVAEIESLLRHAERCRPGLARRDALDFGCGVGRLTQALAGRFERVTGIDISEEMLRLARRHDQHADSVRYQHNSKSDLGCLPDDSFDFVLSMITLQHIKLAYVRRYLRDFVRICRPGGVLLLQMPATQPRKIPPLNPPTPWRIVKRWLRLSFPSVAKMEMHALPRSEMEALLTGSGATVLDVVRLEESLFESYLYIAAK
ncbi:MAG TPA: class I SAM-dependent methyltransferase [Opitutaceae bacterium]|nr:class I SAM-dependent methyltransferase [Opitutaceae bacterium]